MSSYKLSITFNTFAELSDFVKNHGAKVMGGEVMAIPGEIKKEADAPNYEKEEVKTEKKSNLRTKKEKVEKEPEVVEASPSVSSPTPQPEPSKPAVQPESVVAKAQVAPEIDRASAIAKATQLVNQLKASGLPDGEIMPNIHAVYQQAGCPLNLRISQFDDVQLSRFLPLFEQKVSSIVNAQPASFI